MSKPPDPELVSVDFVFTTDAALNDLIAAHRKAYEAEHGRAIAMHARRPLGAGKARITFRLLEKKPARR